MSPLICGFSGTAWRPPRIERITRIDFGRTPMVAASHPSPWFLPLFIRVIRLIRGPGEACLSHPCHPYHYRKKSFILARISGSDASQLVDIGMPCGE
jgi:hypothetical protein